MLRVRFGLSREVLVKLAHDVVMLVDQRGWQHLCRRVPIILVNDAIDRVRVLADGYLGLLGQRLRRFKHFCSVKVVWLARFPFHLPWNKDSKFDFVAFIDGSNALDAHI